MLPSFTSLIKFTRPAFIPLMDVLGVTLDWKELPLTENCCFDDSSSLRNLRLVLESVCILIQYFVNFLVSFKLIFHNSFSAFP